ncbi:type II toxin-antitoxin system HicA family toxin [Pseudomonas faucium]|uniref:type II toxin-antitoxin system HicA family toxin n=2 Tax=Pseudomonas TaxID=286 RepID=UPI001F1D0613|nr:type II toxin-antitoxin system HicA family toxin [Pseudomonas faucium]
MRSREVIQLIEADGWYEVEVKGSHHQFRHPFKRGRVTVPHPKSDLPKGTVHSILKQAGLKQHNGFNRSHISGDAQ